MRGQQPLAPASPSSCSISAKQSRRPQHRVAAPALLRRHDDGGAALGANAAIRHRDGHAAIRGMSPSSTSAPSQSPRHRADAGLERAAEAQRRSRDWSTNATSSPASAARTLVRLMPRHHQDRPRLAGQRRLDDAPHHRLAADVGQQLVGRAHARGAPGGQDDGGDVGSAAHFSLPRWTRRRTGLPDRLRGRAEVGDADADQAERAAVGLLLDQRGGALEAGRRPAASDARGAGCASGCGNPRSSASAPPCRRRRACARAGAATCRTGSRAVSTELAAEPVSRRNVVSAEMLLTGRCGVTLRSSSPCTKRASRRPNRP